MVEPSDLSLGGVDEVVQDQQPGELVWAVGFVGGRSFEFGQVLQVAQRRGSLGLDEALYVDAWHGDRQGQLDDKLIAWGVAAIDRSGPPALDLGLTLFGQAIVDPALVVRSRSEEHTS